MKKILATIALTLTLAACQTPVAQSDTRSDTQTTLPTAATTPSKTKQERLQAAQAAEPCQVMEQAAAAAIAKQKALGFRVEITQLLCRTIDKDRTQAYVIQEIKVWDPKQHNIEPDFFRAVAVFLSKDPVSATWTIRDVQQVFNMRSGQGAVPEQDQIQESPQPKQMNL